MGLQVFRWESPLTLTNKEFKSRERQREREREREKKKASAHKMQGPA